MPQGQEGLWRMRGGSVAWRLFGLIKNKKNKKDMGLVMKMGGFPGSHDAFVPHVGTRV
jgi:hypothetical protein